MASTRVYAARPGGAARSNPEGNERLTSTNGMLLLILLAAEGVTILSVRQLITWHVVIGLILVGPVLLKAASTMYRFGRYYTGKPAYIEKGPPHPILRVLGPVVLLTSLAVLGTGVALVFTKPGQEGPWLFLHKASFIIWFAAMAVHVLGHIVQAARSTAVEYRRQPAGPARRGRVVRTGLIVLSLTAGVGLAAALVPHASAWTHRAAEVEHSRDH
ncbi:MAG TPA: hypothetical protein VHO01_08345 [Jatrophihabitans sp.]|nr:hypothetical protein [Jatrophihabitans sp.]